MCTSASTRLRANIVRKFALVVAAAMMFACRENSNPRTAASAAASDRDTVQTEIAGTPASLECARSDRAATPGAVITLVFSDVLVSPETGDASGFEISLQASDAGWEGWFREATGEYGPRTPLAELAVDTTVLHVKFAIPNGPDSSRFSGRLSCDSLWGRFRAYRTTPERSVTYLRVVPEVNR